MAGLTVTHLFVRRKPYLTVGEGQAADLEIESDVIATLRLHQGHGKHLLDQSPGHVAVRDLSNRRNPRPIRRTDRLLHIDFTGELLLTATAAQLRIQFWARSETESQLAFIILSGTGHHGAKAGDPDCCLAFLRQLVPQVLGETAPQLVKEEQGVLFRAHL